MTVPPLHSTTASDDLVFSLVQGGPFRRVREALGLVPEKGLGLARRALAIVAIAWLPIVIGALIAGEAFQGKSADPLLRHYGVHARLLISVPLLIFAEGLMEKIIPPMIRHFVTSGLVDDATLPRFKEALEAARRFRDSIWGPILAVIVISSVIFVSAFHLVPTDEISWAVTKADGRTDISFAGWWYIFVARPVFLALLVIWFWRILVLWTMVWRLSKLDLRLVASHPDRVGGLGFLESATVACAPLVLAISVVIAGRWGHEVIYHGVHVDSLKPLAIAFLTIVLVVFNGPLLLIGKNLSVFKRQKLMEYSALVGNHGYLVYQKWIRNQDVGAPEILNASELGPVVNISAIYESVARMRLAPISKRSMVPIVAAALLPLLPVFAIEVPFKEMLSSLAGALL